MEDKQRKQTRLLVIGAVIIIFLFIVVRIITYQVKDNKGIQVYEGPVYDSIVLPEEKSKLSQFEEQQSNEQKQKYDRTKESVFMDFKSAYTRVEKKDSIIAQPNIKIEESSTNANYDTYTPVERNNNKVPKQNPSMEKVEIEVVEKPEAAKEVINPFGTMKSIVSKSKTKVAKDMFRAEIYGDQKVIDGGGVVIRSTEELFVNQVKIPKNSILYGIANYSGDRVKITVTRAKTQLGDEIINLRLFDNDYIEGIYFKAPQDEAVDKTKDDLNDDIAEQIKNSRLIVKGVNIVKNGVKNAADAVRKDKKLQLEDGYIVYLNFNN